MLLCHWLSLLTPKLTAVVNTTAPHRTAPHSHPPRSTAVGTTAHHAKTHTALHRTTSRTLLALAATTDTHTHTLVGLHAVQSRFTTRVSLEPS
jgi:hypothetical protein